MFLYWFDVDYKIFRTVQQLFIFPSPTLLMPILRLAAELFRWAKNGYFFLFYVAQDVVFHILFMIIFKLISANCEPFCCNWHVSCAVCAISKWNIHPEVENFFSSASRVFLLISPVFLLFALLKTETAKASWILKLKFKISFKKTFGAGSC